MKKRVFSILLVLTLILSSAQIAFASEVQARNLIKADSSISEINEVVLEQNQEHTLVLQLIDYENGDASIITLENNAVINETYIDRSQQEIIRTDYDESATTTVSQYEEVAYYSDPEPRASYQRRGTISYGILNGTGTTITKTETAIVNQYETINKSAEYNINGKYKDLAALITRLCSVLAAPAAIIRPIAGQVFVWAGAALTAINVAIPDYYVDCVKYSSNWMATDLSSSSNVIYMSGLMYVVTYNGETTRPTVEDYYAASAFSTHDQGLAEAVCRRLWGYPNFRVTGWANG